MNRLLLYFRQAWQIVRQEKLFSSIYILGTALSIMMVMVLAIIIHIRLANIYPETNRDRTLYVSWAKLKKSSSSLSLDFVKKALLPLENAEAVTAIYGSNNISYVQSVDRKKQYPVTVRYVDDAFWKVFSFRFIEGVPFTSEDLESGINRVVIAASLAKKIFGTVDVVGREISMDYRWCRITGVVQDASFITATTYASIWMPYTACVPFIPAWDPERTQNALGRFSAYILAPSVDKLDVLEAEIKTNAAKYNAALGEEYEFSIYNQPHRHWQKELRSYQWTSSDYSFNKVLLRHLAVFLVLLAVPAICLSGMTDSRMERRVRELGVRRAFGARNSSLFMQVIGENLLFTFLGGFLGLLLSYLTIYFTRNWIMGVGNYNMNTLLPEGVEMQLTPGMLLNVPVFLVAFMICIILNVLSAFIPAWKASRRAIVESLKSE